MLNIPIKLSLLRELSVHFFLTKLWTTQHPILRLTAMSISFDTKGKISIL